MRLHGRIAVEKLRKEVTGAEYPVSETEDQSEGRRGVDAERSTEKTDLDLEFIRGRLKHLTPYKPNDSGQRSTRNTGTAERRKHGIRA